MSDIHHLPSGYEGSITQWGKKDYVAKIRKLNDKEARVLASASSPQAAIAGAFEKINQLTSFRDLVMQLNGEQSVR